MAMATSSAATVISESSTMTPTAIMASTQSTTFASLPREIRDKIYGLVLPHSQTLQFGSIHPMPFSSLIPQMGNCRILATYASGPQFAREACMIFFQNNTIRVSERWLPKMLSEGPFANLSSYYMYCSYPYGAPMIHFDVKTWIRRITVELKSDQKMDGLADRVGLLSLCPVLREVKVFIWKYPNPLKRIIGSISNALKPLEEKKGCRLRIYVDSFPSYPFDYIWSGENIFCSLKELEDAIRDKESNL